MLVTCIHILGNSVGIETGSEPRHVEKLLDLRCKRYKPRPTPDVKRLHTQAIPRKNKGAAPKVHEAKAPHPIEHPETLRAPLLPSRKNYFCVSTRSKDMAKADKNLAKLYIVEDLPVQHNPATSVKTPHGLPAFGAEVDDGKAPMAKGNTRWRLALNLPPVHDLEVTV